MAKNTCKILITDDQGAANQNNKELSPLTYKNVLFQNKATCVSKDMYKKDPHFTFGE